MVELMKSQLRKIARMMAGWPVIGRFVRIGVAVIRLPEFRTAYLDLDLNRRQHVFEAQQLPTLLQTLSDLNHRQLASDNDRDNLVKSVPVALRKITRDLADIQKQLESELDITRDLADIRRQLESESNSVGYLLGRVEFVRRELMFEMRYGASTPSNEVDQIKAKTEILSPEKLAAARNERLRLNLGCGHILLEGYLNVDRRALPGVDVVAEVNELPFEQEEVDEIFSAHLLEHFPQEQLRRELLPYFFRLLKEGGEFNAVVPDAEAMIQEYSNGQYPYDDMREVFYGAQDYDGDFHFNMFTPDSLSNLLFEAGLVDVKIIDRARKNGACFEFEIKARRLKNNEEYSHG
jgi:predicted SAM-dependent methyltransferase